MPAIVKPKASPFTQVRFSARTARMEAIRGDSFERSVAPWNSRRVRKDGVGLPDEPVVSPYQTTCFASSSERKS
jgi:hypothetical protein